MDGIIELTKKLKSGIFIVSGLGCSIVTCPDCKQEYEGHPRVPKTLIYRCNECGHIFDIEGRPADTNMLHAGGVFFAIPDRHYE